MGMAHTFTTFRSGDIGNGLLLVFLQDSFSCMENLSTTSRTIILGSNIDRYTYFWGTDEPRLNGHEAISYTTWVLGGYETKT